MKKNSSGSLNSQRSTINSFRPHSSILVDGRNRAPSRAMLYPVGFLSLMLGLVTVATHMPAVAGAPVGNPSAISTDQIDAMAEKQYAGDGLAVMATETGAWMRCVFQKMEGEVTREGLWLTSTAEPSQGERFRLVASQVGRGTPCAAGCLQNQDAAHEVAQLTTMLPTTGQVSVEGKVTRFVRPGLVEEYSVSTDGVRQDFVVTQKPEGFGELQVQLDVTGARVERAGYGARLTLQKSGRNIAYSRLHVTDALGRELLARIEVMGANRLAGIVADADAVYPIRIDPTFSDANWISMDGGFPGANGTVYALAVSGSDLYAGGEFSTAGGSAAIHIAKWNGGNWSALGSGLIGGGVYALAVSGSNVYAGGSFTTAGGSAASRIAKWNGSSWSALGSGISGNIGTVYALAVSGSNVYAGGAFATAGGSEASNIAKWDGSSWSALGSGLIGGYVYALAVSGSNVYAGGAFTTAGGNAASRIAKWNGSSWSALGSGMSGTAVYALAVSGSDLYAGGRFATVGGAAIYIAKWNGSNWSALGSGMNNSVIALAVLGSDLYAGGYFTTAGGKASDHAARAIINAGDWLRIQKDVPGPNTNTLTYVGVPGSQYLMEFSTNLSTGPWFTLATNTPAANGVGTVQDPAATNAQRFYRVNMP